MVEALSGEWMMRRPVNGALAEISSSALAFLFPPVLHPQNSHSREKSTHWNFWHGAVESCQWSRTSRRRNCTATIREILCFARTVPWIVGGLCSRQSRLWGGCVVLLNPFSGCLPRRSRAELSDVSHKEALFYTWWLTERSGVVWQA